MLPLIFKLLIYIKLNDKVDQNIHTFFIYCLLLNHEMSKIVNLRKFEIQLQKNLHMLYVI